MKQLSNLLSLKDIITLFTKYGKELKGALFAVFAFSVVSSYYLFVENKNLKESAKQEELSRNKKDENFKMREMALLLEDYKLDNYRKKIQKKEDSLFQVSKITSKNKNYVDKHITETHAHHKINLLLTEIAENYDATNIKDRRAIEIKANLVKDITTKYRLESQYLESIKELNFILRSVYNTRLMEARRLRISDHYVK